MPPDKMTLEKLFATLIGVVEAGSTAWEAFAQSLDAIAAQVESEPAACVDALRLLAERARGAGVSCRDVVQDSRDTLPQLLTPTPPKFRQ